MKCILSSKSKNTFVGAFASVEISNPFPLTLLIEDLEIAPNGICLAWSETTSSSNPVVGTAPSATPIIPLPNTRVFKFSSSNNDLSLSSPKINTSFTSIVYMFFFCLSVKPFLGG